MPPRLAPLTAAALPVAEGVTAALLLAAGTARAGALAALVLLGGFTVAMGRTLAAGRRPSCHCFGQLGDAPIGAASLARNALLAFLAAGVLAGGSDAEASPATAVGDAGGGSAVNVLVAFLLLIVLRVGSAPRV